MKISIVIPAFNEEKKIGKVIRELKDKGYDNIIIVDDGSFDKTSNEAKKRKAVVLKHIINRGQGAGLRTGIDYALKSGAEIIVTFDADGQHLPEDIPKLVNAIKKGKADIAVGSRFLKKRTNVPFIRSLFLKGGALSFRLLYGIKLTDSHNGLRAMSKKAATKIKIFSDDMNHASEIIEQIAKHKLKFVEVPVTIKYTKYSKAKGQSTLDGFKIITKMLLHKLLR